MCCAERFFVENGGYLAIHLLQSIQLGETLPESVLIGMLCVALHTPLQPVLTDRTGLPDDFDPDVATPPLLIQRNLLDHQPNDLLAVG